MFNISLDDIVKVVKSLHFHRSVFFDAFSLDGDRQRQTPLRVAKGTDTAIPIQKVSE